MVGNGDYKQLVRQGYDSIADKYLDFILSLPSPNMVWLDKLLNALPAAGDATVLEVGCGNGQPVTSKLASSVKHVTANDLSETQILLAKRALDAYGNVRFVRDDMASLSFAPASFDAVLALYSSMHLPRAELPVLLASIHRWLRSDGLLLCNFDPIEDAGSVMDDWLGTSMLKNSFGIDRSKQIVREAGFVLLESDVVETVDGRNTAPFLWCLARKPS